MTTKEMAEKVAAIMDDRKAKNIEVIDTTKMTDVTDYFIICSGTSTTHVKAIADEVEFKMKEAGVECSHTEGYDSAQWILLDFTDVVAHVFIEDQREYYNLERLWRDSAGRLKAPAEKGNA